MDETEGNIETKSISVTPRKMIMIPQESMRNEIVIEVPKKTIETSHDGKVIQ